MRREDEWMKSESVRWIADHAEDKGYQGIQFPVSGFNRLGDALKHRVIRQALLLAGGTLRRIGLRHVDAVTALADGVRPQARIDLPNRVIVERTYDRLVFKKTPDRPVQPFSYTVNGPGTMLLDEVNCTVSFEEMDATGLPDRGASQKTAFLDADQLTYPLIIRNIKEGDRFIPLGMSGHRKIKDFFIDLKIPLAERARIPILTHHDMPIWVCGLRIDDRFKVTQATKRVLKVTLEVGTPKHGG
jgi:tRNA(Ile)-lysidine synthase